MIRRHPALPDPFLVLERKESFGDYARCYGDRLADHYENLGVIVVPFMPIACDYVFLQQLAFSKKLKKMGTINGIEAPLIVREENQLKRNDAHPFVSLFPSLELAIYFQAQIASFNAQLREGLARLFPRYHSLQEGNITWRFTETGREGLHYDIFRHGAPMTAEEKTLHRLKLFINVDSQPRQWRISHTLRDLLTACRNELPDELPNDMNVLADIIDRIGIMERVPAHEIDFPFLSAVIANGETVMHEVVHGRRAVGAAFFCKSSDMRSPARHVHDCLPGWLAAAGIPVAADPAAASARYRHLKGGYERLQGAI